MRNFVIIALTATLLASCTQDIDIEIVAQTHDVEHIYASFEEDTRVELNTNKQTVWTEGDMIVRYANGVHDVWKFDGKSGDRSGSFSHYGSYNSYVDFDFGDKYYALYSYENYEGVAYFNNTGEPALVFNVEPTQTYKPNTYDPASNIMLGISDNGTNFTLRNLMGYLRLSLTGEKAVSHITLSGNNDEVLNGRRYVKYDDMEVAGWYDNTTTTTTLDCGTNGVQLTSTPTVFYFTLAPTLFSKGISVEVHFTDGTTYPISTSKEIVIERNTIQPMATVNTENEIEWQTIILKHYGTTLYAPYIIGGSTLSGYIEWGDGNTSDINIYSSYKYGDSAEQHDIVVKTINATCVYLESCAGISEIDLTNF